MWNIHSLQRALGSEVCRLLPFAHALAECDTTSRLFGIGKGVDLRRLNTALTFKQIYPKYYAVNNPAMTLYLPVRGRSVDLRSSYGDWRGPGCFALPTVPREGIE